MSKLEQIFHEELAEAKAEGWDGKCCFCGKRPYTCLAHNNAQSKAHYKMVGDLVDAPISQVVPSCTECNMAYEREIKVMPLQVVNAGRRAVDYYIARWSK